MIVESTEAQIKHECPNIANAVLGAGFRVLVGCEESQEVTKAFRELGYEASLVIYKNVVVDILNGTYK